MKHLARITTLFAIVGLSFSPGPRTRAQEASQKLTAVDEFQFQLPVDPQISPDGKKIVYVRRFADPATDRRYSNLWIINADGTDHRALTTGNHNDASPRWSPDGSRIAYLSDATASSRFTFVGWTPARPPASPMENKPRRPSPGRRTEKCSRFRLLFRGKVLTWPIFPRPLPVLNGRIPRLLTIAWFTALTAPVISSRATCRSSLCAATVARRGRLPAGITRTAATSSA